MPVPPTAEDRGRPPEAFAAFLAGDEPLFLVGGQAVNLWALCYRDQTGSLAPFVSRDVDVLGDRQTLARIARTAGVKPQFFPRRPPTNEVGVVIARGTDGTPLPVEVLSHLHGVGNDELSNPAYTMLIGDSDVTVRVPGPIALLQAKIANVADLAQTGRQDIRYVRILAQLMPAYLADMLATIAAGRLDERTMLGLLERLLAILTTRHARHVLRDLGLCRRALFAGLESAQPAKVQTFLTKRLPRAVPEQNTSSGK